MKHEMIVLNSLGDSRMVWHDGDAPSIAAAMAEFDRLMGLGYRGVTMTSPETGTMIRAFDATAERLTMIPRIHAG